MNMFRMMLIGSLCAALLAVSAMSADSGVEFRGVLEEAQDLMADGDYSGTLGKLAMTESYSNRPDFVPSRENVEAIQEAWILRIRASLALTYYEEAITQARQFIGRAPESPRARKAKFLMAEAFARMKGFDDAARIYREQVDFLSGDDHERKIAGYYLALANKAFEGENQPDEFGRPKLTKDYRAALRYFLKARAIHAEKADAARLTHRIAVCQFELGQYRPAIAEWAKLLEQWPESEWADEAMYLSGVALARDSRHVKDARAKFIEVREKFGDSKVAPLALIRLAESYQPLTTKDEEILARAQKYYHEFRKLYPSHEEAEGVFFNIGEAEYRIGHYEAAIAEFGKYLAAFPDAKRSPVAKDRIARSWFARHEFDRAIGEWKAFLGKWPNHELWTKVQGMIAEAAIAKGRYPLSLYEKAEQKDQAALLQRAAQGFKSFLMEYPVQKRAAEAQYLLGEIKHREKDIAGAISLWKITSTKYANTAFAAAALFRVGGAYEKDLNDLGKAIETYEDLVARYPRSREANAVRQLLVQFKRKLLEVVTERVRRTDEKCVLKVRTRNIESLRFRAYRVNPEEVFRNRLTLGRIEPIVVAVVAPEWTAPVATESYEKFRLFEREVELPLEGPGAWIVTCHDEDLTATTLVVISDLRVVVKEAPDQTLLFAVNEVTGEVVPGARVILADGNKVVAEGNTGEDGVFVREEGKPGQVRAFAEFQGHVAYTGLSVRGGSSFGYSTKVYLYTDRPLYRPGHEVELKGICRRVENGNYVTQAGEEVKLSVRDSRGTVVFQEKVKTDEYGTFSGSLHLNGNAATGDYRIIAELQDRKTFTGTFAVREYKLPEFTITARTDRRTYLPGEEVKVKLSLKYFFGGGVPNTIVRVRLGVGPFSFDPSQHDEFAWFTKDPERERERQRRESAGTNFERSDEIRTDADGNAEFVFKARNQDEDLRYVVLFEALDLNRQWVRDGTAVVVTRQAYFAMAKSEKKVYRPKEEFPVRLTTVDGIHFPVARKGELVVSRRTFVKDREVETTVSRRPVETGDDGKATVKLDIREPGEYRLSFVGEDRGGNLVRGGVMVTVAGEAEDLAKHARLVASRQIYREGEVAEVLVLSPVAPAWALLTFEGERVLDHRVVRLTERSTTLRLLMKPIYSPNVFVKIAIPRGEKLNEAGDEIFVFKYLTVEVAPDRREVAPGEKVGFTVRTSDQRGQPVPAQVSFSLVDQAVLALEPDRAEQIKPFFYDQRRTLAVVTGSSYTFRYHGTTGRTNKDLLSEDFRKKGALAFNRTMKYLQNAKEFIARKDLESAAIELRKALKVTPGQFEAELLLENLEAGLRMQRQNELLKLAANAEDAKRVRDSDVEKSRSKSWKDQAPSSKRPRKELREKRGGAGKSGASPNSPPPPAESPGDNSGGAPTAGGRRGYGANGSRDKQGARPAPKASSTPPAGGDRLVLRDTPGLGRMFSRNFALPPTLRQRFADTAAWRPSILTGANGEARVEVELPDNLTTWRAVIRGVTKGALVGEAEGTLTARKDLLVRVDTPRFLTQEDEVTITATVHNNTEGSAETSLRVKTSPHLTMESSASLTARVGPRRIRPSDFRLRATGQGLGRITVTALSGVGSDAARSGLPILPRGLRTLIGRSGHVTEEAVEVFDLPDDIIPGTKDLTISLSPGLQGSLLESVAYLGAFPYGCLEQTVNRFLPAIALEDALRRAGSPNARLRKGLAEAVTQGLLSLYSFQNSDGTFGWWSGRVRRIPADGKAPPGRGDPTMTALAILCMERARIAGYRISEGHRRKAQSGGNRLLKQTSDNSLKALLLFALARAGAARLEDLNQVYRYRDGLTPHALATLALAMKLTNRQYNAVSLLRILETKAVDRDGMISFPGSGTHGVMNDVETTAFALRAMLALEPGNTRIPGMAAWLMSRRRGPRWISTRDTGAAVIALADFLVGESIGRSDFQVEVWLNDQDRPYQKIRVAGGKIADDQRRTIIIDGARLRTGRNQVKFVKKGPGRLFYTMVLNYVTAARDIEAGGNLIRIGRSYVEYLSPALIKEGVKEIKPGFTILRPEARPKKKEAPTISRAGSGDKFRVRLVLSAREKLPYVIVEDPLPAGVEVVSGQATGPFDWQERRDEKQVFFLTNVPKGTTTLTYLVQAIHPGRFTAMPAFAYPMYEPAIWGRSAEQSLTIVPESGVIGRPVTVEGVTPDEIYQIAVRDFREKRFKEAAVSLSRLLGAFKLQDKVREECQAMLMRSAFALGDDRAAVTAYEELVQLNPRRGPKNTAERRKLGAAYQGISEFERAVSLFKGVTVEYLARELEVAETYRAIGNPWLAQAYTARVLAACPDSNAAVDEAYRNAIRFVDLKRQPDRKPELSAGEVDTGLMLPEALVAFRSFIANYPKSPLAPEVSRRMVNVLSRMERFPEAVSAAEKFIRRYRDSAYLDDVYYYLAETFFNEGRNYEKVFAAGKVILDGKFRLRPGRREMGRSPYIPQVLYLFGKIHHLRGELDQAVGYYRQVASRFEDARDALTFLTSQGLRIPESASFKVGETPRLTLSRKNLISLDLRIYPVDLMLLIAVKKDLRAAHEIDLTGIATKHRSRLAFADGRDYRWHEEEVPIRSIGEKGVYLVVAKSDGPAATSIVIVSDLDLSVQRVGGKVRVYAVDRETREPMRDVFIKVSDGRSITGQGFTDARGVFEGRSGSGPVMVVAEKDGHFALFRR